MNPLALVKLGVAAIVGLIAWNLVARTVISKTIATPDAFAVADVVKKYEAREREIERGWFSGPTGVSRTRRANDVISRELASAKPEERGFRAAQIFIGFYLVNTRARADYCAQYKIDIANFVAELERVEAAQYARAAGLLGAKGIRVDELWERAQGMMKNAVSQDMAELGRAGQGGWSMGVYAATSPPEEGYGLAMPELCHAIAQQPISYAKRLDLRDRTPELERALMGS